MYFYFKTLNFFRFIDFKISTIFKPKFDSHLQTLIALAVMCKLFENRDRQSGGFLVLVPNLQLIPTWVAETKKHTRGFCVLVQQANGALAKPGTDESRPKSTPIGSVSVTSNTIVVTTMARCRAHPLTAPWLLVVIDECLSVQNKDALQTEEGNFSGFHLVSSRREGLQRGGKR